MSPYNPITGEGHAPEQVRQDACAVYLRRCFSSSSFFFLTNFESGLVAPHESWFKSRGPIAHHRHSIRVFELDDVSLGLGEVSAARDVLIFLLCDFDIVCVLCLESLKKKIERQKRTLDRQREILESVLGPTLDHLLREK